MQIFLPIVPLQYEMTGYLLNKLVGNYRKNVKHGECTNTEYCNF